MCWVGEKRPERNITGVVFSCAHVSRVFDAQEDLKCSGTVWVSSSSSTIPHQTQELSAVLAEWVIQEVIQTALGLHPTL